jgi:hypothetical protein
MIFTLFALYFYVLIWNINLCMHSSVFHISINNKCSFTFYDPFHPRNILQTKLVEYTSKLGFYTSDSVNFYWECLDDVITWLTMIVKRLPAANWRPEMWILFRPTFSTHTDTVWRKGFMKCAFEMGSGAIIYISSFINIGSGSQKLIWGDT